MVTAVLETMPPSIPESHNPTLDPNFFSRRYPTNPRVENDDYNLPYLCRIDIEWSKIFIREYRENN